MSHQLKLIFKNTKFTSCRWISTVTDVPEKRLFKINFSDGTSGRFPYIWLRDSSLDPSTYSISDSMKARRLMMRDFDVQVTPEKFEHCKKENCLKILWPGKVESVYPQKWLKSRNLDDENVKSLRRKIYLKGGKTWDTAEIEKGLKKFDHFEVMKNDKALHDFLEAVCDDGIALLVNGPKKHKNAVEEIGNRIGLIHQTHFGKVFEVTTKMEASNMAYASGDELPYHTDFPSLTQPPELQMLHMYQRASNGGLSMFVDGFKIAELMREQYPEAFEILTTTPLEYIEEGYDIHERDGKDYKFDFNMKAHHKVIKLDDHGNIIKIQFGNAMRSWFYDTDPENIQKVYDALKLFTKLVYSEKNQLVFQMENGETVLWANTRLLHARSAYTSTSESNRCIYGCYFLWDIVKARVRFIRSKLGLPQHQDAL